MGEYTRMIGVKDTFRANQIIKSAKEALCDLVDQEVFDTLDQISGAEKQLEDLNFQIHMAESKLNDIRQQIKKEEAYERTEAPKAFLRRIVTQYTGDYAPGDKVFRVKSSYATEDCKTCHGKKLVSATLDGEEIKISCPTCKGAGEIRKVKYIVTEETIRGVHLKLCFGLENRVGLWNNECVFVNGSDFNVDPKYIFRDKEQAEAMAKELNSQNG